MLLLWRREFLAGNVKCGRELVRGGAAIKIINNQLQLPAKKGVNKGGWWRGYWRRLLVAAIDSMVWGEGSCCWGLVQLGWIRILNYEGAVGGLNGWP